MKTAFRLLAAASTLTISVPAQAKDGDPVAIADGVNLDLLFNARLRYETVDQASAANDADAITFRLRFGGEIKASDFSVLAEAESTRAFQSDYNDTLPGNGVEPFPVVADPESIELNRAQVSWMKDGTGVTVGRQRIILDNARFVGNVGWRQNEQTFDAVRGQAKIGPATLDATYSNSLRTIFGSDSPNEHFDGDIVLLNAGAELAGVEVKAFSYLIDYDTRAAFSSQTYGVLAKASLPLPGVKLSVTASYARQGDYGANPVSYSADYYSFELGSTLAGFSLGAGYEELGSDGGVASFQTPLATLHAFNGWADMFLTTPAAGLRDYYVKAGKTLKVPGLPGLNAAVVYHKFDSDFGGLDYGTEWDAQLGLKLGPITLLAKYADFNSDGFASDTEKLWLQTEYEF
ncbi:alginate export family protein [Croceibacterium aestuarii]|uniref:alginate export family protein n=1 Tax=Croceibacterium aestuarii TaxID=3064139 RepID=UPI00272EA406|nr:alginate export family protein [Croceibacterium sp. D39]